VGGTCGTNGREDECVYNIDKRPLGRPRRRWRDNIKMHLLVIGFGVVDWIGRVQDRYKCRALVNAVINFRVLLNAGNLPNGSTTFGPSSYTQVHRMS
jgi:hypothetical protein